MGTENEAIWQGLRDSARKHLAGLHSPPRSSPVPRRGEQLLVSDSYASSLRFDGNDRYDRGACGVRIRRKPKRSERPLPLRAHSQYLSSSLNGETGNAESRCSLTGVLSCAIDTRVGGGENILRRLIVCCGMI